LGSLLEVAEDTAPTLQALLDAGDLEGAYVRVVDATQDSLYRFLRHMLRDEEAARRCFRTPTSACFGRWRGFAARRPSRPGS